MNLFWILLFSSILSFINLNAQWEPALEESFDYAQEPYRDIQKSVKIVDMSSQHRVGSKSINIALLVPKSVIGDYAKKVSNAILAYFSNSRDNFEFEVFNSYDESDVNIVETLKKIKQKGYNFVIAPCTLNGANIISSYEESLIVYIPTINSKDVKFKRANIIYGGIDYQAQIDRLLHFTNGNISVFSGEGFVADKITHYIVSKFPYNSVYLNRLSSAKVNLKYLIKDNQRLNNSSVFLNMPLVSSSLIASSFSTYDITPYGLFSTQINYSPMLFSLIQKKDRKNFFIANSIFYINSRLNDINQNLGNKIEYDWVSYSASIGLDFAYASYMKKERLFNEEIIQNQVQYGIRIVNIDKDQFKVVK